MRILMTVSSTSLMDGIGRHILAIAPALNSLPGIEVGVVTLHPWGDVNEALKHVGVKCWSLNCANGHQFRVLPRFCRIMRSFHPDIIHGHVTGFFEGVAHKWLYPHVRLVVTIHGISDPVTKVSLRSGMIRALGFDRFFYFLSSRKADAHIFVSKGVRDAFQRDIPSYVVYNPMSFESRIHASRQDGLRVIGTACRVEDVKNPLAFTRILGEVTKRFQDVEAWVIGDGSMLASCRRLAEERGYVKIRFLGLRNDAKRLIAQMDCFVLTSRREGLPTSLLEAMSVKTPFAFMSGDGGLQDLVQMNRSEGPFAVVAAPEDESAMVDGICDLLKDPAKAASYAERAFVVGQRHFDLGVVAKDIGKIYESLVGC